MDAKVDPERLPREKVGSQEQTLALLHRHNLRTRKSVKRFKHLFSQSEDKKDKREEILAIVSKPSFSRPAL